MPTLLVLQTLFAERSSTTKSLLEETLCESMQMCQGYCRVYRSVEANVTMNIITSEPIISIHPYYGKIPKYNYGVAYGFLSNEHHHFTPSQSGATYAKLECSFCVAKSGYKKKIIFCRPFGKWLPLRLRANQRWPWPYS